MDAHVLVTRCCSYPCIPECFHLHLLHCIHCIASVQGESQLQGELDVCMCQQGGEGFGERSGRIKGCLIFELVVHRALRVHHFVRVARVRGNAFQGEFLLCLAPGFLVSSSFLHDCVEPCLCL